MTLAQATGVGTIHHAIHRRVRLSYPQHVHANPGTHTFHLATIVRTIEGGIYGSAGGLGVKGLTVSDGHDEQLRIVRFQFAQSLPQRRPWLVRAAFVPYDRASADSQLLGGPLLRPPADTAQKANNLARSHGVEDSIEFYPEHRGLLVPYFLEPRGIRHRLPRALDPVQGGTTGANAL